MYRKTLVATAILCVGFNDLTWLSAARAAIIKWDAGANNGNWSSVANWENNTLPSSLDVASFGQIGATTVPDIPTIKIGQAESIGGVVFENQLGRFHTFDLGGFALNVGGPFLVNLNATAESYVTVTNGDLSVGGNVASADFAVGCNISPQMSNAATLDLRGVNHFDATVDEFLVGAAQGGSARGILRLASDNVIHANRFVVSSASEGLNFLPASRLEFGRSNVVLANEFLVGGRSAAANVVIASGGTLQIGNEESLTDLSIGRAVTSANMLFPTTFDLRNASRADLHLSQLTIGERIDTQGNEVLSGSLWGAHSGTITVGTPNERGNISIGHGLRSENAQGLADFRDMDQLSAYVQEVRVGVADASSASGELYLPRENMIDADAITVGRSNTLNSAGRSVLRLGQHSVLRTKEFTVGSDMANGLVEINSGGLLELGTADAPARLIVAQSTDSANILNTSTIDLRGARTTMFLQDVIIGERININGAEATVGIVNGGNAGSITIGTADQKSSVVVGHAVNAFNGNGTLDLSELDQLNANLSKLSIGWGENGIANGIVSLPRASQIDAEQIVVGRSDAVNAGGTNVLRLGQSTLIRAHEIQVGSGLTNGQIEAPSGAVIQIGAPDRLTNLTIARSSAGNANHTSAVDLQSAQATLYLADLTIGSGSSSGILRAGSDADIHADRILLADGTGKATLQFSGGNLIAGEVLKGAGIAIFDWSDGFVQVDRWGTPMQRFDLANLGTGSLIAGADSNSLELFGDYRQGEFGTMRVIISALDDVSAFNMHGAIDLAGTLRIDVGEGASLSIGDRLQFLTYTSRVGEFTSLHVTGELHGFSLQSVFDDVAGQAYLLVVGVEGDANGDGRVDLDDLNAVRNNFGSVGLGDTDGDNDVDLDDLNNVRNNFGTGGSNPVPEPSSLALLALGAVGIAARRRMVRR